MVVETGDRVPRVGRPRRAMYHFFVLGFFAIFSTTISKNPVLPLFSQALGADDAVIGLIAAFSPLAGILFSFPMGVLSDHLGRKRLLVASGLVFLTAPLLYLLVSDPVWLIPVRFFHGTATAILGPVVSAAIAERFTARKGEALGQYASATLVGRTLAPLAGGAVITSFISLPGLLPYRLVYLVAALAAVPVLVVTLVYRETGMGRLIVPPPSAFREGLAAFVADRWLRGTALAEMATYFAFGASETFLPLLLASRGVGAFEVGILFAVQVLIIAATKPLFGRMADRMDKRIQIALGLAIVGASIAAMPFAPSFPAFLAAGSVFGLGISVSTVATSAYVADLAGRDRIGASMGALSSIMDIGHAAGPLMTGLVVTAAGFTAGFLLSLLVAGVVTVVFAVSVADTRVRAPT